MVRPLSGQGVAQGFESRRDDKARCRSSGVEHSLGKGEVQSSNLCGSTTSFLDIFKLSNILKILDFLVFKQAVSRSYSRGPSKASRMTTLRAFAPPIFQQS